MDEVLVRLIDAAHATVRDHAAELLVAEHDLVGLTDAVEVIGQRPVGAGVAASVEGAVADDRVEPGLQADLLGRAAKRVP